MLRAAVSVTGAGEQFQEEVASSSSKDRRPLGTTLIGIRFGLLSSLNPSGRGLRWLNSGRPFAVI